MRYTGILQDNQALFEELRARNDNPSLLEVGVGLGSVAEKSRGMVSEYCGVDISLELITHLSSVFEKDSLVSFRCADATDPEVFLGKKFDVIFSTHTLEHVASANEYFRFIARHLTPEGIAIIIFPNESEEMHHGILWFDRLRELQDAIEQAGLGMKTYEELRETLWRKATRALLWDLPKKLVVRKGGAPQIFEDTRAFRMTKQGGLFARLVTIYAMIAERIISFFPAYTKKIVDRERLGHALLLIRISPAA